MLFGSFGVGARRRLSLGSGLKVGGFGGRLCRLRFLLLLRRGLAGIGSFRWGAVGAGLGRGGLGGCGLVAFFFSFLLWGFGFWWGVVVLW